MNINWIKSSDSNGTFTIGYVMATLFHMFGAPKIVWAIALAVVMAVRTFCLIMEYRYVKNLAKSIHTDFEKKFERLKKTERKVN